MKQHCFFVCNTLTFANVACYFCFWWCLWKITEMLGYLAVVTRGKKPSHSCLFVLRAQCHWAPSAKGLRLDLAETRQFGRINTVRHNSQLVIRVFTWHLACWCLSQPWLYLLRCEGIYPQLLQDYVTSAAADWLLNTFLFFLLSFHRP